MDYVYLLLFGNGSEWEDIIILLSKEDAVNESIKYPNARVEIFHKVTKNNTPGYTPTYNYYKKGNLVQASQFNFFCNGQIPPEI